MIISPWLWLALFLLNNSVSVRPGYAQYGSANAAGSPVFHLKDGTERHGAKCFAIKWFHGKNLLLCPLHTVEPLPGDKSLSYIDPSILPDAISSVEVMDLGYREVIARGTHELLRKSSIGMTGNLCDDLAAFELSDSAKLQILGLCGHLPARGTRVWIISKTYPSQTSAGERFPGTVVESTPTGIDIKLDQALTAHGSSGAPVIDARNQVIGMVVGTGDEARTIVNAAPSTGIYQRLFAEVGQ